MAGISHVLNLAKEALVTHQLSIAVTGHNVANVNTPGYSRQTLGLTNPVASPTGIGYIGNGVQGERVEREYDRFMVQRLVQQESTLNNLEAQHMSMRLVETAFNEAPGMAVNELMSEFWSSWQDVADNPELISARQSTVQQALLINEQLHIMTAEIAQSRQDISSNLQSAVLDVNSLTTQIADLNLQITSGESDIHKQNDLRDQRDELTKELGQFVDINYFEMETGSYTILLEDGHSLVESNSSWSVKWDDRNLNWQTTNANGQVTLTTIPPEVLGGKMGGWIEIHDQLIEGQPENYLGRLDSLANSFIREVNQVHTQGVGLFRFDGRLESVAPATDTTRMLSTVDAATALEDIPAGTFTINDREVGAIEGAVAINGLAMGKTANAATQINDSLSDVKARMTTLTAGNVTTGMTAPEHLASLDFTINGLPMNYIVDFDGTRVPPAPNGPDNVPANLAANIVDTINTTLTAYNTATNPVNVPKVTIEAAVGSDLNGGVQNSIILRNTNPGDESQIVIAGIDPNPLSAEQKLGLSDGTYVADNTHNTGEITLFNHNGDIVIDGGSTDVFLSHLGLAGGQFGIQDAPGDGKITYEYTDSSNANIAGITIGGLGTAMEGYAYSDELITDGTSFKMWIYNNDDTLALPQAVDIPMDRVYTLYDVANAINVSIENASDVSPSWIQATVENHKLVLTPDNNHSFAFGGDTSNLLATAGLNTFFSGHDASTINVNTEVKDHLENLAAGQVSQYGEIFNGDETNALLITNTQRREAIDFIGGSANTLDGHYNSLVASIGLKGRTVERDFEYNTLVTNQMQEMRDSISGVNLDEEMANLIKFQHAYSAAAKLITTSDEMLQTLLNSLNR